MLHLEPVVGACLIGAIMYSSRSSYWNALVTGSLLGIVFSCHYAYAPGVVVLGGGFVWLHLRDKRFSQATIIFLSAVAWASLTPLMNYIRYGHPFQDGYSQGEAVGWHFYEMTANIPWMVLLFVMVPWWAPVLVHGCWQNNTARLLVLAIAIQSCAWLGTWQFREYPLRYMAPWVMASGLLLPGFIIFLEAKCQAYWGLIKRWGFFLCMIACVLSLSGWQESRPVVIQPDHPLFGSRPLACTWYTPRTAYVHDGPYFWVLEGGGGRVFSPYSPILWYTGLIGLFLIGSGGWLLWWGIRADRPSIEGKE